LKKGKTLYSREEAKKLKEKFWTGFGQFMALVPGEDGQKINWINYKTGIRHLFFRMDADNKNAHIYIEIAHPDEGIRLLMFEQFQTYRTLLHAELDEEWEWDATYYDAYGKPTSRIGKRLDKRVSVFRQEDWPDLIAFFKPRMMALDAFWSTARYGFDLFK